MNDDARDQDNKTAQPGHGHRWASTRVPKYYQLATLLREKILTREYGPGERIPSESELVSAYGVSRMTVRQALSSLEDEGLIRREAGRGTFVHDSLPDSQADLELDRSIDDLISMGTSTTIDLLELKEVPPSPREVMDLQVPPDASVIRCKRLRRLDGEPYCYIVNHMPLDIGRRIPQSRWRHGSVLQFIDEVLGIPLLLAMQRVRATLADANLAHYLQVPIGSPLLLVDYHIATKKDRPVEMAQLYYRSDLYTFTLHLTRSGEVEEEWALRRHRLEQ